MWLVDQGAINDDEFNNVVVVGCSASIIDTRDRFEIDSCVCCCCCLRSVFNESIGVAGGELVSTFVVSRIVTSAENERPQGHKNR